MKSIPFALGHSDAPITRSEDDSLGLAPYAAGLADFICKCETPMTVAIQGDWGTGKTSLMHMVQAAFKSDEGASQAIETIWFQTWQYSQFGATDLLSVSLLSTLLRRIAGDSSLVEKGLTVLKRLSKPVVNAGLRFATAGVSELGDFQGGPGSDPIDFAANAEQLRSDIAKIVRAKRDGGVDRLVIFVDDLDRVPPERAVEILETIKLFVDIEGCVFVLALDYAVVRRGLQKKFGVGETDLGGRSFFDKIIQLPFSIPTARYEMDRYIENLLSRMNISMGEEDSDLFADLARKSVSVNPRGIKRVFNSLQLLIGMAGVSQSEGADDRQLVRNLFALLCLQNRFEPVYEWLALNADRLDERTLRALEGSSDDVSEEVGFENIIDQFDDERKRQFAEFSTLFLEAIQCPEGSTDQIDDQEISMLRRALTLANVTAVSAAAVATAEIDREFRARNHALMRQMKDRVDEAVNTPSNQVNLHKPHAESYAYLKLNLLGKKRYILVMYHGEDHVEIYVRAAPRNIASGIALIQNVADQNSLLAEQTDDRTILLWREILGMSKDWNVRETIIREAAVPRFLDLFSQLKGVL